jgi:glutamate N-acetyltransferase/amino-acid N-acetyltransferase
VDLDINAIELYLSGKSHGAESTGDVCLVRNGGRDAGYREELGQQVMDQTEITVRVVLKRGKVSAQVWTCDLSYDYVRINAEYRT